MSRTAFRMVAVDVDGTLLCPAGTVTPRTKAAVRRAVDAGIRVCFATGRSWRECDRILEAVDHYDSAVFVTGAMVVDTKAKLTIHRRMMGAQLARDVSHFLQERGQTILAFQDREQADVDYLVTESGPLDPATTSWIKMTESKLQRRGDLAEASAHQHTVRISIVSSGEKVGRCYRELLETFASRVSCHEVVIPSTKTHVLEVFEPSVSKWHGVRQVALRHGIADEEIVAVGDDANDVSMIRGAGLGVAMGNARPAAVSAAKRTIGHNSKDGFAEFLEELVAGK